MSQHRAVLESAYRWLCPGCGASHLEAPRTYTISEVAVHFGPDVARRMLGLAEGAPLPEDEDFATEGIPKTVWCPSCDGTWLTQEGE